MTTIDNWLNKSVAKLQNKSSTAQLDCLILLEDTLNKNRAHLLAHPSTKLTNKQITLLNKQIERRANHKPLAYIRGKTEFYGREFIINNHTLEPRPETETMIELLLELAKSNKLKAKSNQTIKSVKGPSFHSNDSIPTTLVDVGTGSGAIAVTAKLELPYVNIIATDIDAKCLKIAKQNAKKHKTTIDFRQGNLLEPLLNVLAGSTYAEPGVDLYSSSGVKRISNTMHEQRRIKSNPGLQTSSRVFGSAEKQAVGDTWILLANLPYVPDNFKINKAATHEPKQSIFGGENGMDLLIKLFKQTENLPNKPLYIITESLPPQHSALKTIAKKHRYKQVQTQDFIQAFEYF